MAHFEHHSSYQYPPQLPSPSTLIPFPIVPTYSHPTRVHCGIGAFISSLTAAVQHPYCLVSDLYTLSDLPQHPNCDLCLVNES